MTPEQKIASLKKKLEEWERESWARGVELTRINDLVERVPMPEPTRILLRQPLKSYLDRCTQGKGTKEPGAGST